MNRLLVISLLSFLLLGATSSSKEDEILRAFFELEVKPWIQVYKDCEVFIRNKELHDQCIDILSKERGLKKDKY